MTIFSRHPFSFLAAGLGIVLITATLSLSHGEHAQIATGPISYVSAGNVLVAPGIGSEIAPTPSSSSTEPQMIAGSTEPLPVFPVEQQSSSTVASTPVSSDTPQTNGGTPETTASGDDSSAASNALFEEAYSYIPTGLATIQKPAPLNPTQQALYIYGNQAGLAVLTFETTDAGMADTLKTWLASRGSSADTAHVAQLGQDMIAAGNSLANLTDVPASAQAANTALAESFKTSGQNMIAVSEAGGSDTDLGNAMKTYDTSADSFTQAYLALVSIFSINNVHFLSSDPGSAFEFSGTE